MRNEAEGQEGGRAREGRCPIFLNVPTLLCIRGELRGVVVFVTVNKPLVSSLTKWTSTTHGVALLEQFCNSALQ